MATDRYHQILLSGLLIIFFTILQHKNEIFPKESTDSLTFEDIKMLLGMLGGYCSYGWFVTIEAYLYLISRKYEVLKELENQLEFQFFTQEWKILGEIKENKTYRGLSIHELFLPFISSCVFWGLLIRGVIDTPNRYYLIVLLAPIYMVTELFIKYYRIMYEKRDNRFGEKQNLRNIR